jgi:DNA-binding MltR family transcriptional regulator
MKDNQLKRMNTAPQGDTTMYRMQARRQQQERLSYVLLTAALIIPLGIIGWVIMMALQG